MCHSSSRVLRPQSTHRALPVNHVDFFYLPVLSTTTQTRPIGLKIPEPSNNPLPEVGNPDERGLQDDLAAERRLHDHNDKLQHQLPLDLIICLSNGTLA